MAKIYLDPGHGGHDPGAVGKRSNEKTNVLNVAKELAEILRASGHTVKLSRTTDVFISLTERANDANSWGADIFVSLHNNAATSTATGFETFVYSGGVSANTKRLQNEIHSAIAGKIGINDRGKKSANFAVVRQTKMPAVLVEYAFITNVGDEKILTDKVNDLAKWTAIGVNNYFGKATSAADTKAPKSPSKKPSAPKKSSPKAKKGASLTVDGKWGKTTTKALQRALGTTADGIISRQPNNSVARSLYGGTVTFGGGKGSPMVEALQRKVGARVDGKLGPATVRALQKYLGTTQDGVLSRPSLAVKEMQRRLNAGTF